MIEPQDLRAAVGRGIITEGQAAQLTALAEARRQALSATQPAEEPFVLFRGFNEIFIVIGLSILFMGWVTLTALSVWDYESQSGDGGLVLASVVTLAGLAWVARYFTLKRRMIAPSIALVVMTALTAGSLGWSVGSVLGVSGDDAPLMVWTVVLMVMVAHYRVFRVPFSAAIIACAAISAVWSFLSARALVPADGAELLGLMQTGPAALLSLVFGLVVFAMAMRFDMSDPLRVSTRSATGFWLHVVAAPSIVNPVAFELLGREGAGPQLLLLGFLLGLAVVAVAIDRRSFLVSGAAYAVALAFTLFDGSALVIVGLGLGLVLLGAQWERLRGALMRALPEFPGKHRLPPYGRTP